MEFRFDRKEPGVWISAGTHVALLAFALFSVAAPALPEAQEGVPVEVITENQFSEITKGERQADKPMPNAQPRADRQAEKVEDREPENAKTDAPTAPKRTAEMKLANAEEMPLRAEPDPQEVAKAAKAAEEKREAEKAAAKAAEKAAEKAAADKAAAAAKAEAKAAAKAEAEKREQLDKLIERQEAEAVAAAEKAAAAKAEAKAKADAAKAEAAREAARKAAEAKAEAEAERQKEMAEAKAAQEKADAAAKAEAAAKAKAKAMADAKAKADGEAKARKQAELADKFNAGDIRSMLASKAPSQSTGATGHTVQKVAALGAATGTAQRLSPSLRDALVGLLQQQIERCYSAPPGAAQGVVLPVLDIRLNPNGSLSTEPRIMRGGSSGVDQSIAQAALRAVRRCAPYNIPATYAPYYNDWKAINAEFEFTAT
ncbi:cell envelope integrity protein TolA [Methylobacterium sp. J-077]|uniref:cell envelope integrity protein TolA n=1 Tax=Methylobacterium sp. J-077 TaxID=2836656 RepID=UPI001FB956B7|nr:cell envelope integrity protein TolA [Methylobacterium sp. J-077]MCJ2121079.1 cell envelope integrity protein TolA [Methylobacterium sp. J-077]